MTETCHMQGRRAGISEAADNSALSGQHSPCGSLGAVMTDLKWAKAWSLSILVSTARSLLWDGGDV